ncbi:unnamed protein product [Acanthosepion pharaonis]|uniref:Uncharacterized protein n=1 Tax=Acanthosepion pharaonis TaxID=158019 RepID=A0A812C5G6_ACAPH|nr:unnamed protein product [Sepia pharaonis]
MLSLLSPITILLYTGYKDIFLLFVIIISFFSLSFFLSFSSFRSLPLILLSFFFFSFSSFSSHSYHYSPFPSYHFTLSLLFFSFSSFSSLTYHYSPFPSISYHFTLSLLFISFSHFSSSSFFFFLTYYHLFRSLLFLIIYHIFSVFLIFIYYPFLLYLIIFYYSIPFLINALTISFFYLSCVILSLLSFSYFPSPIIAIYHPFHISLYCPPLFYIRFRPFLFTISFTILSFPFDLISFSLFPILIFLHRYIFRQKLAIYIFHSSFLFLILPSVIFPSGTFLRSYLPTFFISFIFPIPHSFFFSLSSLTFMHGSLQETAPRPEGSPSCLLCLTTSEN